MTNPADTMSHSQVLKSLQKRREAVQAAEDDLATFLLDIHDSSHWPLLRYRELAVALGCSKQAVQQRVARLLERGRTERSRGLSVHPGQGTLFVGPDGPNSGRRTRVGPDGPRR